MIPDWEFERKVYNGSKEEFLLLVILTAILHERAIRIKIVWITAMYRNHLQ